MKILVFRIGQLGDTVAALPALWTIRRHFPGATLALLSDFHPRRNCVLSAQLLTGAGLFDEFLSYQVDGTTGGRVLRPARMAALLVSLRLRAFDTLVYLTPSLRTAAQIDRDRRFFSVAGIKQFLGTRGFPDFPPKTNGQPLATMAGEADLLLARLAADGIPVPQPSEACFDLNLGHAEEQQVAAWLRPLPADGDRPWLGIGPGSKMPAKRWPLERFAEVGSALIARHGVWPVVFGGPEDEAAGAQLLAHWGCGYNAAGPLALRPAAVALKRCRLYLGNDTGTMHLAAALGVTCAAVFSSRDYPGRWHPHGPNHRIFRTQIDCEGCRLIHCLERKNECLNLITVNEVLAGCDSLLSTPYIHHPNS